MAFASLPQLAGGLFLSDGGLETSLIYLDGLELPHFAAFALLKTASGRAQLRRYYEPYLDLAAAMPGAGFVLESPTWRASADWGRLFGYDDDALAAANRDAVQLVRELRDEWQPRLSGTVVLAGIIGPRGDGYAADAPDSVDAANAYHRPQASALKVGGADIQLRSPEPLRLQLWRRWGLGFTYPGAARQCIDPQPRRARCRHRAGHR